MDSHQCNLREITYALLQEYFFKEKRDAEQEFFDFKIFFIQALTFNFFFFLFFVPFLTLIRTMNRAKLINQQRGSTQKTLKGVSKVFRKVPSKASHEKSIIPKRHSLAPQTGHNVEVVLRCK
jgi:hypothetical protein